MPLENDLGRDSGERVFSATHANLVGWGDALRNADNEADLVLNGLDDGVRRGRWWYIQDRRIGLHLAYGLRPVSTARRGAFGIN